MARFTLATQIEEIEDLLHARRRELQGRRSGRSLEQYRLDRLHAAARTLAWLQRHERVIRERCPELFGGTNDR